MKFKPFLMALIISALFIAGIAGLFSITGIATLFSGHFYAVIAMMIALELSKVILASFLYRYWTSIKLLFKIYLVSAMFILMIITSAGIFGFLSESYQKTKGDYTIIESQVEILESKKNIFLERKLRLQTDKQLELNTKVANQIRADSLTARGQSITRTRKDIKESEAKIVLLENSVTAMEDSVGFYDMKIIEVKSKNIQGELGPLKYIADVFGTNMDVVVKWLILILIFVFDPLAVSLIIAANMVFSENINTRKEFTEAFKKKVNVEVEKLEIAKKMVKKDEKVKKNNKKVENDKKVHFEPKIEQKHKQDPTWHSANWHK